MVGNQKYRFGKRIAFVIRKQLFQPMKKRLTLSTDRKSASEGEYIDIRWTCDACPDSLYLAIDSEHTQYSIAVSDCGVTRIPVPKSNGKMTIKLVGVISGKKVTEKIDIRVKATKKAGTKAPLSNRIKMFGEKLKAKWYVFRAQVKYWWLSQKKWQKIMWIAILTLWLGLLFSSIGRKSEVKESSDQVQTAYLTDNYDILFIRTSGFAASTLKEYVLYGNKYPHHSPCDCTASVPYKDPGEGHI